MDLNIENTDTIILPESVAAGRCGTGAALWLGALAFAALLAGCAHVPEETYKPRVGQAGKDVIWVPSLPAVVERMLDLAKVTREDFVMDLGSGDGRNIIAAGRRGARAVGVEFNADLVGLSNRAAAREGVAHHASFVQGDMFAADISQASVHISQKCRAGVSACHTSGSRPLQVSSASSVHFL